MHNEKYFKGFLYVRYSIAFKNNKIAIEFLMRFTMIVNPSKMMNNIRPNRMLSVCLLRNLNSNTVLIRVDIKTKKWKSRNRLLQMIISRVNPGSMLLKENRL